MKKLVLALLAVTAMNSAIAQKETKYAKLFYKDLKVENSDVTITVDNAVSTDAETKFKLKITNKTNQFLIFKPEECKFVANGKEIKPLEKWLIISPNDSDFRVINIKGPGYNSVKSYSFIIDGIYKVSAEEKGIPTPDFKLPASKNDFKTGNFSVKLNKLYKESDATKLSLDVTYNGDQMGVVNPEKAGVVMPDGKEYAAVKSTGMLAKSGPVLMKKGETESVTLKWDRMEGGKAMDMQKVDMMVKFNDMFSESTPQKSKPETLNFEFDEAMSNEKGK
ncbi:MAG: hypothetical protein K0Q95_540 [Bacteroidota bacterium]|jgi:archaellum component FlaF (FlaF/FlaG flagellin family)|nr:hypothetical protein [Bacteroidota bacterium]